MNTDLITKINNVVQLAERYPSDDTPGLYMGTWENEGDCGTTRCIAGWAIQLTTGSPVYVGHGTEDFELHPDVRTLARRLDIDPDRDDDYVVERVAAKLLDVDPGVFYTSDETAIRWLEEHSNPGA